MRRQWWKSSAITPPSERVPLFSREPPLEKPPLEPEPEADEPRTAGKSSRRRGRIVVSDDDDDDTPSDQDVRKALAASDDDDEAALAADEEDEEYGLEEVDSEDEAVMSDASSEGELASRRFKPSPNAAREFKEWTARTLREKGGNLSSGRLMREPLTQRGTLPWHRTIPNPEFPQLGIKAVQQDNNDKSKQACIEVFGSENDDCSVHLGRHLELLLLCKNKRPAPDAPSVLENLQRDFNRIKNVPTLALLWLCCYFFVVLWVVTQPGMAAYFESHAFVFRWTRVQVGARGLGLGLGGALQILHLTPPPPPPPHLCPHPHRAGRRWLRLRQQPARGDQPHAEGRAPLGQTLARKVRREDAQLARAQGSG
jgi:hypothetical protein